MKSRVPEGAAGKLTARIIEDLYAGTLDADVWSRALVSIADLVGGSGSALLAYNPTTGECLRDEIHRLNPQIAQDYRAYWDLEDHRTIYAARMPLAKPFSSVDLGLDPIEWRRSAVLNEFLTPLDVPYALACWLHKSPEKGTVLTIQGAVTGGPFTAGDCRRIARIVPHFRRAFEIRDRLEVAQFRADSLACGIDRLAFGVVVLDNRGRILEANSLADQQLSSNTVIARGRDSTLWLRGPAGVELRRRIVADKPARTDADGFLHIPRNSKAPLSVTLIPVPNLPIPWASPAPRWLLFIFDPERSVAPTAAVIARDLGLTAREAEIAALLSIGESITSIAIRLQITLHTVRSHLRSIFLKTGIQSQSDLIRRVITGPASVSGSHP